MGLNVAFSETLTDAQARDIFGKVAGRWITATYSLTLVTNILTTGMYHKRILAPAHILMMHTVILALKIWQVARRSARYLSGSSLTPILRVIVESGAVYSVTVAAALVAFLIKSNVVYVILDLASCIHRLSIFFPLTVFARYRLSSASYSA